MNYSHQWKVVPLSSAQLLDVRREDILEGGHFRKCSTLRGGGGYDVFPLRAEALLNEPGHIWQFVVQLFGCNLDCPYCYVTREGVWGDHILYTTDQLVQIFKNHEECSVFHLMGGAPALQLKFWNELSDLLSREMQRPYVFHSDLMLSEGSYRAKDLEPLRFSRNLFAVNIKGFWHETYLANTRKELDLPRLWINLERVIDSGINFYITFTGVEEEERKDFWDSFERLFPSQNEQYIKSSAVIDIIEYDVIKKKLVDRIPWGGFK